MQLGERDDPGDQPLRAGQKQIRTLTAIFPFTTRWNPFGPLVMATWDIGSENRPVGNNYHSMFARKRDMRVQSESSAMLLCSARSLSWQRRSSLRSARSTR